MGTAEPRDKEPKNSKKGYTHDSNEPTRPASKATSNWLMAAVGPGTADLQPRRCPHPHHRGRSCKPYNRQGRVACVTAEGLCPSAPSIVFPHGGACVSGDPRWKERKEPTILVMTKAVAQARSCDPGGTKNYNRGTVTPLTEKVESMKCHSDRCNQWQLR